METTEQKIELSYCNIDKLFYVRRNDEIIHYQKDKPNQTEIVKALGSDDWKSVFDQMRGGKKVRVSYRIYYEMLGCVPPRKTWNNGFAVGEAYDGNIYHHFWKEDGFYYGQLKQLE